MTPIGVLRTTPTLASCERTLSGHAGPVYSVVVDDAAGLVYTGSADMTIKAWSIGQGNCLRTLTGHFGDVSQLVLDTDGDRLFSASDDNTVGVWSTGDGSNLAMLTGHVGPVTALAHDRTQHRLFSASFDTSIRVWTTVKGGSAQYRTLRGQHSAPLVALALLDGGGSAAPQNARLYSASSDGYVTTWDVGGRGPGATSTALQVFEVVTFRKRQSPQRLLQVGPRLFVGTTQGGIHEYWLDANGVPSTGGAGAKRGGKPAVVTLDHMFSGRSTGPVPVGRAGAVVSTNRIDPPGPDRALWGDALATVNYAMPSQYGSVFALASTWRPRTDASSEHWECYWLLSGLRNGGILVL